MTEATYKSEFETTKCIPYLALTGELWDCFGGTREKIDSVITASHYISALTGKRWAWLLWAFWWKCRSSANSPHKGQWRGALMFSLICVWIDVWVNNGKAGDLRRHRAHCDVIVMSLRYGLVIFNLMQSGVECFSNLSNFCTDLSLRKTSLNFRLLSEIWIKSETEPHSRASLWMWNVPVAKFVPAASYVRPAMHWHILFNMYIFDVFHVKPWLQFFIVNCTWLILYLTNFIRKQGAATEFKDRMLDSVRLKLANVHPGASFRPYPQRQATLLNIWQYITW